MKNSIKRVLSVFLTVVLIFTSLIVFGAQTSSKLGDVNDDGIVNSKDVIMLKLYLNGKVELDETKIDINSDGVVDTNDVNLLSRIVAGSEYFDVEFDINYEGGTTPETQSVLIGEKATSPTVAEREGYQLIGWFSDANTIDISSYFDFENTAVITDIKLYAVWFDTVTDTDSDGLLDDYESCIGTDLNNADTDNDGLTDYQETAMLGYDPLKFDTDDNGVCDAYEDFDGDTLTNIYELENSLSASLADTDGDGLNDNLEIDTYNTDPTLFDTDGDEVSDGKEIELGTDPLVAQTSFDMNITSENEDSVVASVEIQLSGAQVETLRIDPVENDLLFPEQMPGYLGQAYDFYVDGEFDSATINFEFDNSLIGTENFDPVIYYYNEEEGVLEELATSINGNVASTDVTHFSTYMLINRYVFHSNFKWDDVWQGVKSNVEIVFVVDDSGSMGPVGANNDPNNTRLTVSKELINNLPTNSKIGVVKFGDTATVLTNSLISDIIVAKSFFNTNYFQSLEDYTYMYTGIDAAFSLFESTDSSTMRIIVVLSDGMADDTGMQSYIISKANENDVNIYTVGLGSGRTYFESYLKPLANNTGGKFYYAFEANELSDIYKDISEKIDLSADNDNDGIPNYYEDHMVMFNGVTMELDKNKRDTDGDGLFDGQEIKLNIRHYDDNGNVVAENGSKVIVTGTVISDPSNEDTDGDGLIDPEDDKKQTWNVCDRDLAMFAALSYETPEKFKAGTVDERKHFLTYAEVSEVNKKWKVVDYVNELCCEDTHFSATTYESYDGMSIVIAIRGTDENPGEWIQNILGYGLLNYHIEESYAEAYALKIAKKYSGRDIYITGHSLGGYLAQHAAAKLYEMNYSDIVKDVVYFNGMGLDSQFAVSDAITKDEKIAMKYYANNGKLTCFRMKYDVVSAFGTHYVEPTVFNPTQDAMDNCKKEIDNKKIDINWSRLIPGKFTAEILNAVTNQTVAYVVCMHETDSFLYYLRQGTRDKS